MSGQRSTLGSSNVDQRICLLQARLNSTRTKYDCKPAPIFFGASWVPAQKRRRRAP